MTTDIPSVDEARGIALERILAATEIEDVREALSAYRQAILDAMAQASLNTLRARDQAIRERDEAIALLRRTEWGGMDMSGGAGSDKHCPSCLNSKETGHWEECAVAAFLARFPEGGA